MNIQHNIVAAATTIALLSAQAAGAAEPVSPRAVGCKLIRNVAQLQAINSNQGGSYCLANDIDAGSVANFPILVLNGGKFFGNNHAIRNVTMVNNSNSTGLFALITNAVIQDLRLVNVNITGTQGGGRVGGLIGRVEDSTGNTTIKNVHVSGQVQCTADGCIAGGIVGLLASGSPTVSESSSSAAVSNATFDVNFGIAGGAVGQVNVNGATILRTVATGNVSCLANNCYVGGLVGVHAGLVDRSAATGAVSVLFGVSAGGLIGRLQTAGGVVRRSHASGPVDGGTAGGAGGLIGHIEDGTIEQSYSVGKVSGGGNVGGLAGNFTAAVSIEDAYWDTQTSQQMTSAAGVGMTTKTLRTELPNGFDSNWAITANKSYPYLNDADIDLTLPLATLIRKFRVFAFLPIGQFDESQYAAAPANADGAALATVYTMIARAIGIARNVAALKDVKIDTYFWKDATQVTKWRGPVVNKATLGALTDIPVTAKLNNSNVIGAMKAGNLVILRGSYPSGGGSITHWMLGTLYTLDSDGKIAAVVAHDPWTGRQVTIDPKTRKVVSPADFPLSKFKVDGYQPVMLN